MYTLHYIIVNKRENCKMEEKKPEDFIKRMRLGITIIRQNTKAHIGRTLLVFITIIISAALIFVAGNVKDTAKTVVNTMQKKYIGNADLTVEMDPDSNTIGYEKIKSDELSKLLKYNIGFYQMSGYIYGEKDEKIVLKVSDFTKQDIQYFSVYRIVEEKDDKSITKDGIIISKTLSDRYNIKLNEILPVYFNNEKYDFTVEKIAEEGLFLDDGAQNLAVVSKEFVKSVIGSNLCNKQFLGLKDKADKDKVTELVEDLNKDTTVKDAIDSKLVQRIADDYSNRFIIIIFIVVVICLYLIYSNFAIMYREEIPTIGILRSLGASNRYSSSILFIESLTLGIVGGVIGCALGIGILNLLIKVVIPEALRNLGIEASYNSNMYIITVGLTTLMVFISSLKHIIFASKFSIKDIILGNIFTSKRTKFALFIPGVLFILIAVLINRLTEVNYILSIVRIILCIVGVALTVATFIVLFNKFIENLGRKTNSSHMLITAFIARNNKIINSNVIILAFCLACLMLVNTIDHSIYLESRKVFGYDAIHEIELQNIDSDPKYMTDAIEQCKNSKYVDNVYKSIRINSIKEKKSKYEFEFLRVYDDQIFKSFNLKITDQLDNTKTTYNRLSKERCILLSELSQKVMNIELNDTITLNNKKYVVVGTIDTPLRMGIVSNAYYEDDFDTKDIYSIGCVHVKGDINKAVDDLNNRLKSNPIEVKLTDDIEKVNYQNYKSVIGMLQLFCYLSFVICILGCINNFTLSFLNRRKQMATMLSIGSSRRALSFEILIESFVNGFVAFFVGSVLGVLLIQILPEFMTYIQQYVKLVIPLNTVMKCFIFGILVTILSSIAVVKKIMKLSIVENIKYE